MLKIAFFSHTPFYGNTPIHIRWQPIFYILQTIAKTECLKRFNDKFQNNLNIKKC